MATYISFGPKAGTPASQQKAFKLITLNDVLNELPHITQNFSYSAIEFDKDTRLGANFKVAHSAILDFDDGMTILHALETFKNVYGMIVTTKSHQQTTKGGLPDGKPIEKRDRFRVILFLKEPIIDPKEFVTVMTNMINTYGSDPACKDLARYYFPNPTQEVWFMENATGYIDIEPFKQNIEKQKVSTSSSQSKKDLSKSTTSKEYLMIQKDQEIVSADGITKTAKDWYEAMDIGEKITIHCLFPEHEDNSPSAFMVKTDNESLYSQCASCGRKGFYNVNSRSKNDTQKAVVEQHNVTIQLFSQAIIDKLKTTGDFDTEAVLNQFLNCGIPITSFGGALYFYIEGYWRKHNSKDEERKLFLKKALEKILGKRPKDKELNATQKELHNEYYEFHISQDTFVNFQNEILKISKEAIEEIPHNAKYGMKYKLPYVHDPQQRCPSIDAFLCDVMGDEETVTYFYQFIASAFLHNEFIKFEKALFFYGEGSNGKSVVLDLLIHLFGYANISHVSLKDIADEKKRRNMVGKILNIASEGSAKSLESEDFKAMVSRETLSVKSLYKDSSETNDFPRLIFATNNMPQTGGDYSKGIYRRISIIPFEMIIPEEKQDKQLLSKLLPELPGMINRVLRELVDIVVNGKPIVESKKVILANQKYAVESNPVQEYVEALGYIQCEDNCPIVNVKNLYKEFKDFCFEAGIKKRLPQRDFSKRMSNIFGKQAHSNKLYGWRIVKQ